jgi:ATP-dependent Clp protease ATP-binding subunit ClpC
MNETIDTSSARAQAARFGQRIGQTGYLLLLVVAATSLLGGLLLVIVKHSTLAYFCGALTLATYMPALWWRRYLSVLPPSGKMLNDRLSVDALALLQPSLTLSPVTVWVALSNHWQARFLYHHLLLPADVITQQLSNDPAALSSALATAVQLADQTHSPTIEVGFIVAGLLINEPKMHSVLTHINLQPDDMQHVALWLGRGLQEQRRDQQDFGGIGRDWAFGFTPLLNKFGDNLSLGIASHGAHFGWLTTSPGVISIETAFDNHASAIALIGPDGIGKTTSVYALAQRLIEGNTTQSLAYHQIISLKAAVILSNARGAGDLEHIMLSIANEAMHAGHVILFFDDAQLFFNGGPGAFDASQILLQIIRSGNVPAIFALSPSDYQRLRTTNTSFSGLLTPVILQELAPTDVMRVLEDAAISIENRHNIVISYDALREAYVLSGRYEQDEAYPGKAIKLLEQAISYAQYGMLTNHSVQQAIEQTTGVKVGTAVAAEADALLNLEDKIHERMINQSHAVSVVANALRRARAGVSNPRRPIGSFLFLGPTGVGKTELAKAIAATYFNNEHTMVRLDMSEYQQPEDIGRLLSSGQHDTSSLIMSVRQQPFSVVLLDEIEKAHPNILNLLLQLLDEGQLTDSTGRSVSFKDCIIIATSNAGAATIRDRVTQGQDIESFRDQFTDELIQTNQFKPELLNRFDELVLFRPLNASELGQVVRLMLKDINITLGHQSITLDLTDAAVARIVTTGNDPRLGARPMRRALQRAVEDVVAQKILRGEAHPGDKLMLDVADLNLQATEPVPPQPVS